MSHTDSTAASASRPLLQPSSIETIRRELSMFLVAAVNESREIGCSRRLLHMAAVEFLGAWFAGVLVDGEIDRLVTAGVIQSGADGSILTIKGRQQ